MAFGCTGDEATQIDDIAQEMWRRRHPSTDHDAHACESVRERCWATGPLIAGSGDLW